MEVGSDSIRSAVDNPFLTWILKESFLEKSRKNIRKTLRPETKKQVADMNYQEVLQIVCYTEMSSTKMEHIIKKGNCKHSNLVC